MQYVTMIITMLIPAGASSLRPVRVSLPRVGPDRDQPKKYALPENMPPPKGVEVRPLRRPRASTLRSLVRLAVRV